MNKTSNEKSLLSISEVAKIFGLDMDTLRNWEKRGIITPLRVGPRGDRKYRPEDLEKIANEKSIVKDLGVSLTDDAGKMNLTQLKQFLWRSADILRGKIDSSDYKKYIFPTKESKFVNYKFIGKIITKDKVIVNGKVEDEMS